MLMNRQGFLDIYYLVPQKSDLGLSTLTEPLRQAYMQADLKHVESNCNYSTLSHMKHVSGQNTSINKH
jgi:hypothetical protein